MIREQAKKSKKKRQTHEIHTAGIHSYKYMYVSAQLLNIWFQKIRRKDEKSGKTENKKKICKVYIFRWA